MLEMNGCVGWQRRDASNLMGTIMKALIVSGFHKSGSGTLNSVRGQFSHCHGRVQVNHCGSAWFSPSVFFAQ